MTAATILTAGPLKVNSATREAFAYGAKLLLTDGEFDLLRVVITRPEHPWTRSQLLEQVPHAADRGADWVMARAAHLTAQLLRAGVRTLMVRDITNGLRLFAPIDVAEAQALARESAWTLAADRPEGM